MHKKIKNIIAVTLVIGTISCLLPSDNFIFGSIDAYASTYKSANDGQLSSLTLTRSTGSEIKLLDSYYGDEVSLTSKSDYYVELTGAEGFEISADVEGSDYVVKQFTSADKTEEGSDVGKYIKIDSSSENVYLRTYKSEDAYKEAYDDEDVTDCEETYVIHVKKPAVTTEEEDDAEYANLEKLYISNGNIEFSKKQYSYDVNVDEAVQEILVRATPEDDNDIVNINGQSVEEANNYEKTISLNKGNNKIEVYVENNDDKETYTLNVYRGKSADLTASLTTSSTASSTQASTSSTLNNHNFTVQSDIKKFNAWQRVDGKWKYIDGTGEVLKNQWWFDTNTGKNYYLNKDGYLVAGWLNNNNNWYYFNGNGEMQTGWISLQGSWYYLSKSGVMQTGSVQDSTGIWYDLDSTGKMIKN